VENNTIKKLIGHLNRKRIKLDEEYSKAYTVFGQTRDKELAAKVDTKFAYRARIRKMLRKLNSQVNWGI